MAASPVTVHIEATNSYINLMLTPEQLSRASTDNAYLEQLIQYEKIRLDAQQGSPLEVQHPNEAGSENSRGLASDSPSALQTTPNRTETQCNDSDGCPSIFIWTSNCVMLMLSLYEEHQHSFQSGAKRHKKIWEEIATKMHEVNENFFVTGAQCQTKLAGLKKTYKKFLDHNNTSGNDRISWPYFDRMNEIFGSTMWAHPRATATEAGPSPGSSGSSLAENPMPKRKKENTVDKLIDQLKENREAKIRRLQEKEKLKKEKLNQLMEMKERHHKEKLGVLQELCKALTRRE